jgi:exopolysaccharide biosynthesis polyprenyl glycosylphosphotransferase
MSVALERRLELPVFASDEVARGRHHLWGKAALDRLLALVLLVFLAPLLLVLAVLVKVTSPGPVLFKQVRVGQHGELFELWKLRSMVSGADRLQVSLVGRNEGCGVLFKMRRDPRVTVVGRWLRRWSLDELPQLVNVLRGQMSLVGPRPPLAAEVAAYPAGVARRLEVKPGLTGLWQVSGRSDLSWEDSVRLDLHYVEHWSLWMDLAVLGRTLFAVARGSGAY